MDLIKHIKQLSGESDWPMWKRKIRDLLDYHEGTLDVIDGRLVKPEPLLETATEPQKKLFKEKSDLYRKANSYAKSMITSSVTDGVYQKIMDKENAHDAWLALRQHFEASSQDQLFKICTDFFTFNWNTKDDVSTHIAKLKSLWNELNNGLIAKGEVALPELLLICKMLQILPRNFETFCSSWMLLTNNAEKTFEHLTVQLCMFERNFKKNTESEKTDQEALVTDSTKRQDSSVKVFKKHSKRNDTCNYCKKKGHWITDCRKWIADGKPAKENKINVNTNEAVTSLGLMATDEICAVETNSLDWWIDNGATRHVTNRQEFFVDFKEFAEPCSIQATGKETLRPIGKGTIRILSKVKDKSEEMTLNDVWYVPNISKNLFSVLVTQDRNRNSRFTSTDTRC